MFVKTLLVSAFAALVAAQTANISSGITFDSVPKAVTDGQPATLTWSTNDTTTPVTILLRQGPSGNLQTIQTLTTSGTGGEFVWTPCTALPNGDNYALQIVQGDQFNYYGLFSVSGYSASGTCAGLMLPSSSSSSSSHSMSMTSTSASSSSTGTGLITSTRTSTSTTVMTTGTQTSSSATFQASMKPTDGAAAPALVYAGSSFAMALGGLAAIVIA